MNRASRGLPMALQAEHSNAPTTFTTALQKYYANADRPGRLVQRTSPWVQGQIDWANCLDTSNTEEESRQMVN